MRFILKMNNISSHINNKAIEFIKKHKDEIIARTIYSKVLIIK